MTGQYPVHFITGPKASGKSWVIYSLAKENLLALDLDRFGYRDKKTEDWVLAIDAAQLFFERAVEQGPVIMCGSLRFIKDLTLEWEGDWDFKVTALDVDSTRIQRQLLQRDGKNKSLETIEDEILKHAVFAQENGGGLSKPVDIVMAAKGLVVNDSRRILQDAYDSAQTAYCAEVQEKASAYPNPLQSLFTYGARDFKDVK